MERKPEDIVKEIDATRERLVTNLDELGDRMQPEAIMRRQVDKVKAYYIDDVSGEIRQDRHELSHLLGEQRRRLR